MLKKEPKGPFKSLPKVGGGKPSPGTEFVAHKHGQGLARSASGRTSQASRAHAHDEAQRVARPAGRRPGLRGELHRRRGFRCVPFRLCLVRIRRPVIRTLLYAAFSIPPRRRRVLGVPPGTEGHGEDQNRCELTHTRAAHAVAAMACPSTPSRRRAVAAMACREPLHHLHDSEPSQRTGIDWERCAARRANSRRPTTTRPP